MKAPDRPAALAIIALFVFILFGCGDRTSPSVGNGDRADPTAERQLAPEHARSFELINEGRPDLARLRLQRHIYQHPKDGQALFLFGLTFHVQSRFDQARTHFETARELVPNYPPVHYFHGWCLYHLGEHDQGRDAFEQYLDLEPARDGESRWHADAHQGLGLIALDQDRLDDAERHFERAIAILGEAPNALAERGLAHARLGEVHTRRGDHQQARQHLTTAVELYPDDHEAWYQLYRVLLALGEDEAAEQARQQHLARQP